MSTPKDRLSRFLGHLDSIFQCEPEFFPCDPVSPEVPKVVTMVYRDVPEGGYITGVTYGLSEVTHPDWRHGRPELILSLASEDLAWPLAMGEVANQLRGRCPFSYGDVINFGMPISTESGMSAFLIFTPSILDREHFLDIDVGGSQPLNLAGVYPIHGSERTFIGQVGLKEFWHHPDFDLYNTTRPAIGPQ